jgi:DNA-binding NtrC family response regulator
MNMQTSVNILTYILEDDVEIHDLIRQLLKEHGIAQFHIYDDPVSFMNDLTADINICVIDHTLKSGLTGVDVIKAVKEKNKRSYVIVMTGQVSYKVVAEYLNLKADKYIDKNEIDSTGELTYLDNLVTAILDGFKEAERRVAFVKYLGETLEKL